MIFLTLLLGKVIFVREYFGKVIFQKLNFLDFQVEGGTISCALPQSILKEFFAVRGSKHNGAAKEACNFWSDARLTCAILNKILKKTKYDFVPVFLLYKLDFAHNY